MPSVRLNELRRSSSFRFALALTAAFLAAYLVAGWIGFRVIHTDLDNRVIQSVELSAETYEDEFRARGPEGLIATVDKRAATTNPEDEFVWLGTTSGTKLAGHDTANLAGLVSGDLNGRALGIEEDDRFRIAVRDFDDLRFVTGRSYEESDEIGHTVLGAFAGATALIVLLAGFFAAWLAGRSQKRFNRISTTLHKVASGEMGARVPVSGLGDDLDRLSEQMNDALGQLQRNVEAIRQVSADIAHDLRTPINRLGILLEQTRDEATGAPALEAHLETATAEVRQITATFDSLLRIAQIEAGARKARFQAISLLEIADALQDAYLAVAEEAGQTLDLTRQTSGEALVYGDRDLLTQCFANLIENAIRHSPDGAQIHIEVGSDIRCLWMSVADNGPGIPAEECEAVTGRFYRLDKSRHTPGSGLGLALVKAISDLHDADLSLTDNGPGLVARITFTPLEKALRDS